jgi:hypothetical protein
LFFLLLLSVWSESGEGEYMDLLIGSVLVVWRGEKGMFLEILVLGSSEGSKTPRLGGIFRVFRKRKVFPVVFWMYEIENTAETCCI